MQNSSNFSLMIWMLNIRSAIKSLMANKLRTILAMLGLIIGVGAVIAMLAMGSGAKKQILSRFEAMGTRILVVRPAQLSMGGVSVGTQQTLTVQDAMAICRLPGIAAVSPAVQVGTQITYMNRNAKSDANGVAATHFAVHNFELKEGRFFTDNEGDSMKRVTVLGPITAQSLFGSEPAVGKIVKVNGIAFEVVGVTAAKGDAGWTGPDDELFVPYNTAMKILSGLTYVRQIDILVDDEHTLEEVSGEPPGAGAGSRSGVKHTVPPPPQSIAALLRKRHHLQDDYADDFAVQNQAEMIAAASETALVFRLLVGSIASISLLIGGVGIMNIMLVTVTERTREIGTRKAIGAKNRDILIQFLMESLILAGIGGVLGALAGIGFSKVLPMIPMFKGFITIIEPMFVILSVSVSAGIGVVFGVYPAWRASRLDPIEALRYD